MRVKLYSDDTCFSRTTVLLYLSTMVGSMALKAQTLLDTSQWLKKSLPSQIQKEKKVLCSRIKWPRLGQWPLLETIGQHVGSGPP